MPWKEFFKLDVKEREIKSLRKLERTGRPIGADRFIKKSNCS
jgi:hypothetical protein